MDLKNILIAAAIGGASVWIFELFLRKLHHRYVDPLPFGNKELAKQTNQSRKLRVKCNPQDILLVFRDAVATLKNSKIRILESDSNFIKVKTGMTFRSFGEVIVI